MERRISLITLGVRDLARSRAFYEALNWRGQQVEGTVFIQAGAQAVVLWGRDELAADAGIAAARTDDDADGGARFGGVAFAHNVRTRAEVDEIVAAAAAAGAAVTKAPADTFYGGYAAYFTDPDGHVWEVAHNPGFTLTDDGALVLPDFGDAG